MSADTDHERRGNRALALAVRAGGLLVSAKVAAALAVCLLAFLLFIGLFISASGAAVGGTPGQSCSVEGEDASGVPASYGPWLAKATQRYELGPEGFAIVAAVHYVESNFGRSTLPGVRSGANFAGAQGPGQFLAATWAAYGVDADGIGGPDPYSVPDSILATANYLHASGAPRDWHAALFSYNHAEWYGDEVLEAAKGFEAMVVCQPTSSGPGSEQLEAVAGWIESRRLHYCWGGGHGAEPGPSGGAYCWSADGAQVYGAGDKGSTARALSAGSWFCPASTTPGRSPPAASRNAMSRGREGN